MRRDAAQRHARGPARAGWRRIVRLGAVVIAVVVVAGVSIVSFRVWQLARRVEDRAVPLPSDTAPGVSEVQGPFDVLLVGADNAPGQRGFGAARDGARNDVNILVHVSADHRSGAVISIPRDLVIAHPQCTDPATKQVYPAMSAQPINTAFARGGLGCVVATVESLTGAHIPYAAQFSFEGTVRMADAVGGVPVCVTAAVDDSKSGLRLKKGVSVVTGRSALAYLRDRHSIGDHSDLSRIQSQQAYMSALLRKMTAANTLADPVRLYSLADAASNALTLSRSMAGLDTMVRMGLALKSIDLDRMVLVQYPTLQDPQDHDKVIPDAAVARVLLERVGRDEPIRLDGRALGGGAIATGPTPSPRESSSGLATGSPSPEASDPAIVAGVRGRTAAQQTCSVASR